MRGPVDRLVHWATTKPDAPALLGPNVRVSYAKLLRGVQARAAWLHNAGVRQGDTVALDLGYAGEDYPRQVALFYAIAYLGATVLPLYPEVVAGRRSALVAHFNAAWQVSAQPLEDCRARWLDPSAYAAMADQWAAQAVPAAGDASQPFLYEFTSGTTGLPKAMLFSGEEYTNKVLVAASQFGWQADDVTVLPQQWPSKVGIRGMVRVLILGAAYMDEPYPESRRALAQLVRDQRVSCIGSSPWQLRRLLASPAVADWSTRELRFLGTAGAFMAPNDIRAVRETLAANFHVGYGTTEIGTMGHLGPQDPPDAPFQLVPGMQAQAIDAHGQALAAGQWGRLRFRAPWIPMHYAFNDQASDETFRDGWFVSGDFGAVDAAGRITLSGRADDVINVGGAKIHPHEVEQALAAYPDVADAAVVGVPDAMAGEIVVAFLVPHRPIALDALLAFLAPRLEASHVPAEIAGMDVIPRNPEGKVLRQALRDIYAQRKAARRAPP